ncbi:hypothetical protein SAP2_11960 [Staphylococcus arlettae]|uniref:Uncharacterized protein n=1 Tax=Staphylococcus arlettae TaxID=29378 RepID=A0ABQ0XTT4_9STAP|nr:hypothetical protein SAP2_11960 [Staphylococcus arlettae]GEQ00080.1 hypothetical protein SAR03_11170 [Staphylococcus arlettae]
MWIYECYLNFARISFRRTNKFIRVYVTYNLKELQDFRKTKNVNYYITFIAINVYVTV